jgi:hypothetical protein
MWWLLGLITAVEDYSGEWICGELCMLTRSWTLGDHKGYLCIHSTRNSLAATASVLFKRYENRYECLPRVTGIGTELFTWLNFSDLSGMVIETA